MPSIFDVPPSLRSSFLLDSRAARNQAIKDRIVALPTIIISERAQPTNQPKGENTVSYSQTPAELRAAAAVAKRVLDLRYKR